MDSTGFSASNEASRQRAATEFADGSRGRSDRSSGTGATTESAPMTELDRMSTSPTLSERILSQPGAFDAFADPREAAPHAPAAGIAANDERAREAADPSVAGAVAGAITATGPATTLGTDVAVKRAVDARVNESLAARSDRRDTVAAAVHDRVTGETFSGVNTKTDIDNLHPVLEQRLQSMGPSSLHASYPGRHAEVHALNQALHARDAHLAAAGLSRTATEADLSSMTLDTAWTKSSDAGGMALGETAMRCANCTQLTDGVRNLAGDSPKPYDVVKANAAGVDPATPPAPASRFAEDLSGARAGAIVGGLAGAGASTYEALSDGELSGAEVGRIASDAALGATTGALGEGIERGVAQRLATDFDQSAVRAARNGIGTFATDGGLGTASRVAAPRLAGAGVAGAVVGAGFASVDQVQAYRRGEISGSEAVGTVVAETATGAAAGVAGAAAGAAIGSVIPVAGTIVGGVVGFAVGAGVGYLADKGLRASGATDAIADGVTAGVDAVSDTVSGWGRSLSSAFGW